MESKSVSSTASLSSGSAALSPPAQRLRRALEADRTSVPAKVADAIGRFDKDDPSQAFSRLGPLADADENGLVRYHLGLALSWLGQVEEAIRQLRLAREADPDGFYGREAERLLDRLEDVE